MHREMTPNAEPTISSMPSLPSVVGLCVLGAMPAFCLGAELTGTETYLGFACLVPATVLFWHRSTCRFGVFSLVGIFSVAAAVHAVGGLLLAGPATDAIWGSTRVADFYPKAFLVISAGLLAASIGFGIAVRWRMNKITDWCQNLAIDDAKLLRWTQVLTIAGAVLIVLVYYKVGYIPLLSALPSQSRYLTEEFSNNYQRDEWLVNRGMDLLTDSLPVILVWRFWGRGWLNFLVATAGCVALLLPLRRANLASIVISVMIMQFLRTGKMRKRYLATLLLLAVSYEASQFYFFNLFGEEMSARGAINAMGSALPEVRDLGWVMSLSNEPWYGGTFFQALLPIPSFVSDFSKEYSHREITTRIIGMSEEGATGGLRLTLAGESYLNFGYLGVVVVGFVFGIACAALDVAVASLRHGRGIAGLYLSSLLFGWLCLWLYLGGTAAAAPIKVGLLLVACLFVLSWQKRTRFPKPARL